MTNKEEVMIEEILLGYLRSSKQVALEDCKIDDKDSKSKIYTLTFKVDNDFGVTLANALSNQFSNFFNSKK